MNLNVSFVPRFLDSLTVVEGLMDGLKQREIASTIGISAKRVSQIKKRLAKLFVHRSRVWQAEEELAVVPKPQNKNKPKISAGEFENGGGI